MKPIAVILAVFFNTLNLDADTTGRARKSCRIETKTIDILERLKHDLNQENNDVDCPPVRGALKYTLYEKADSEEFQQAEMHISVEPKISDNHREGKGAPLHPIRESLVELIDATPAGARIRLAVYIFNSPEIQNALAKAIQRGVMVKVITTTAGEIAKVELDRAIKSNPQYQPNNTNDDGNDDDKANNSNSIKIPRDLSNNVHLCSNKTPDKAETAPGGCLSDHLMHHKFVTFSHICRYGLVGKECLNPPGKDPKIYQRIVFQSTWNFANSLRHNMASVFIGNLDLYVAYRRQFNRMYDASIFKKPNLSYNLKKQIPMKDSAPLDLTFTPTSRVANEDGLDFSSDILLKDFADVKCKGKNAAKKTVVRISHVGWNNQGGVPIANKMIERISELASAGSGCTVRVLISNQLLSSEKLNQESPLYDALKLSGAEIRAYEDAENPDADTHSKYSLVENSAGTVGRRLMFGTLNIVGEAQSNDNVWLSWPNPSDRAYSFYENAFDRIWNSLPVR